MSYATLSALRRLTRSLRLGLRADQRTQGLARPRFPRPEVSGTGGHYVSIARLAPGVDVQLWVDLYSGLSSPRAWVGFATKSRKPIRQLVALASSAGLGDVISRSARDMHRSKAIYQFKNPLLPKEFDVQVLESYSDEYYLGLYLPYGWPFSRRSERAIVRESRNYVAALLNAHTLAATAKRGRVGPWNRPDKAVEKAAISYVKARLRRDGFEVKSRESEICGYDLHATRDVQELHVEVKGVSGSSPRFHISRTQVQSADQDPDWRLAVVLHARVRPRMGSLIVGKRIRQLFHLEPSQWFATAHP